MEAGDGVFPFVYCPSMGLGGDRKQTFQVLELTGHPEAAGWISHWLVCTPAIILFRAFSLGERTKLTRQISTRALDVLLSGLLPHCISFSEALFLTRTKKAVEGDPFVGAC